jgi:hypothetical protein
VENYLFMFTEIANDVGEPLAPAFNISEPGNFGNTISRAVSSLSIGRQYNVAVNASNAAGSSFFDSKICKFCSSGIVYVLVAITSVIACHNYPTIHAEPGQTV